VTSKATGGRRKEIEMMDPRVGKAMSLAAQAARRIALYPHNHGAENRLLALQIKDTVAAYQSGRKARKAALAK